MSALLSCSILVRDATRRERPTPLSLGVKTGGADHKQTHGPEQNQPEDADSAPSFKIQRYCPTMLAWVG